MLIPVQTIIHNALPQGDIWGVIRTISMENEGRRDGWTVGQWQRFCDAFEVTKGREDQIGANAMWRTYRIAKDLLDDGRGTEINWTIKTICEDRDAKMNRPPAPVVQLGAGPRRRRFSEDD